MNQPENTDVVRACLLKAMPFYPNTNAFIMDRACAFAPSAREDFKQIKFWVVDAFNGKRHQKTCPCNPLYVKRLGKRVKGVNMSVAVQLVFVIMRNC